METYKQKQAILNALTTTLHKTEYMQGVTELDFEPHGAEEFVFAHFADGTIHRYNVTGAEGYAMILRVLRGLSGEENWLKA